MFYFLCNFFFIDDVVIDKLMYIFDLVIFKDRLFFVTKIVLSLILYYYLFCFVKYFYVCG